MTTMTATLVGGPTVILDAGGVRIITDPTFDEPQHYAVMEDVDVPPPPGGLTKTASPSLSIDQVGRIDIALASHPHHTDNLDFSGRRLLRTLDNVFTTPDGARRVGGSAVGLEAYQSHEVTLESGRRVSVTAVPAHHGPDGVWQAIGPVAGFILSGDLPTTYVSGDNSDVDLVREVAERYPNVQVAVLFAGCPGFAEIADGAPITFTAQTCLEVSDLWPQAAIIPAHCDSWAHFREGVDDIQRVFEAAGKGDRLRALRPGETQKII